MYSQTTTATTMSSDSPQSDSRLTVADILSSMANGEAITPTTLANFEGFSTGVLTQTTPTLTPTTLRNIEQTFIELQTVPPQQIQHQNQAGFVTPIVNPLHSASSSVSLSSAPSSVSPPPSAYPALSVRSTTSSGSSTASDTGSSPPWSGGSPGIVTKTSGRSMGGRRPAKHEKLTPEEEERRRVRRERNKLAAARCRKRRLDHTNMLVQETDCLEEKRLALQNEIQELQTQKDELEFILEAHKVVCKLHKHNHSHGGHDSPDDHRDTVDVKPILSELNRAIASSCSGAEVTISMSPSTTTAGKKAQMYHHHHHHQQQQQQQLTKPLQERPKTLKLVSQFVAPQPPPLVPSSTTGNTHANNPGKLSITEATGIVISTPSSGIFNFDALMEGGTGLTPVSSGTGLTPIIPTCSTQQRSSSSDLSSPDTITPPKLVSL